MPSWSPVDAQAAPGRPGLDELLLELRQLLAQIQHGSVTLIVQDGQVVQIDTTTKRRFRGHRSTS